MRAEISATKFLIPSRRDQLGDRFHPTMQPQYEYRILFSLNGPREARGAALPIFLNEGSKVAEQIFRGGVKRVA
jgi:hypothetical protein